MDTSSPQPTARVVPAEPRQPASAGSALAEGARILVVEDDVLVRTVTIEALVELGFEVLAAGSAQEALERLEREAPRLDGVVSDVIMPGKGSGLDIARQIRLRWPHLALVLTTGYTADRLSADEMPPHFLFLPKPYSGDELARKLRRLIERANAATAGPCGSERERPGSPHLR